MSRERTTGKRGMEERRVSEGERRATKKVVHSPGLSGGHSARLFDRISAVTVLESSWVPWKGWDNLRAGRSSENSEQHPFTLPILPASLSVAYCNAFLFSAILRGFFFDLCYLIHFQLPVPPVFFFRQSFCLFFSCLLFSLKTRP